MDVIIYHNPDCGTSRNTLGLIHNAGVEPHVIEYLKTPPTRALLKQLIERMGISVRALLRQKGTPYDQLGLDNPALTDDQLLVIGRLLFRGCINRLSYFSASALTYRTP